MRKFLLFIIIVAAAAMGCAGNRGSAKGTAAKSELEAKLAAVVMSEPLAQSSAMSSCDEARAQKAADGDVVQRADRAGDLWADCQELYACSPATSEQVAKWFQSGATFQLGFTDLKALKVERLGDKVGGLYLTSTSKIYLDKSITSTRLACYMLIHELAHRFDPLASTGEVSLRTEYYAYWNQTTYNDELINLHEPLAVEMSSGSSVVVPSKPAGDTSSSGVTFRPYHTRETLMKAIAETYGFKPDTSILKGYKKLPREPDIFPTASF